MTYVYLHDSLTSRLHYADFYSTANVFQLQYLLSGVSYAIKGFIYEAYSLNPNIIQITLKNLFCTL